MDPSIKITQCYRTFFPESQGGLEQVVLEIARGTTSRVLTLSNSGYTKGEYRNVQFLAARRWFTVASCCIGPGLIKLIYKDLADLLHFHYPWPFGDVVYCLAGRSRPLVITYHSDIVRQRTLGALYKPLMRRFFNKADRIVATSENYVKSSDVLSEFQHKIEIIPLGIDEHGYPCPSQVLQSRVRERYGRNFMLFVGVLRYYKGLEFLVRAAVGQGYQVVIAGKGPEWRRLHSLAEQLGAANVHFTGFVDEEEKMALMRLCRAVVLPSHLRSEAFGVTLIEGLMSAKPLISCEIGTGTSFVNVDGETGHVVPPANPAALREAMNDLWLNPDKAERMGWAGRQRYEKLFTGERMAAAYRKLYDEVLSERGLAR
ncbi:glycosyltransferase [Microbulbifer thermotolerans]|uniref:glycosyltransferase n=1 Tax=Microbulbifer thermotolerans TaxID=252514 RepID=UPI002248DC76|nr:glycosyltransferase [Microbulbifer thermotolerans]MCX2832818.1 glycosyltransferase [Microbulbifer thermotolerans]